VNIEKKVFNEMTDAVLLRRFVLNAMIEISCQVNEMSTRPGSDEKA